jgi:hypothetical protein
VAVAVGAHTQLLLAVLVVPVVAVTETLVATTGVLEL